MDRGRVVAHGAEAPASGRGGPIEPSAALPRMHDGEDAYYVTDTALADPVEAMSRTSPPLLRGDERLLTPGVPCSPARLTGSTPASTGGLEAPTYATTTCGGGTSRSNASCACWRSRRCSPLSSLSWRCARACRR